MYTISENRADREANKLARTIDKKRRLAGVDISREEDEVQEAIIDIVQQKNKNESRIFAEVLIDELEGSVDLLRNTHRFQSLAVLTGADLPSVLVELGYLSNIYEERLLRTPDHRQKVVERMVRAIDRYFSVRKAS